LLAAPAAGAQVARRSPIGDRRHVERGIVQSVSSDSLVLRELDGSVVLVPVDASTQVVLNDRPASLADIRPGDVAAATAVGGSPATSVVVVRIVARPRVDRGVIASVTPTQVT